MNNATYIEHPILFKTEMIEALIGNRKTETRRVTNLSVVNRQPNNWAFVRLSRTPKGAMAVFTNGKTYECCNFPYGDIGQVLWVREAVKVIKLDFYNERVGLYFKFKYKAGDDVVKYYKEIPLTQLDALSNTKDLTGNKWRPGIHMPKAACRLRYVITDIQVERMKVISEESAVNEGIQILQQDSAGTLYKDYMSRHVGFEAPSDSYISLWEMINGAEDTKKNPWVWAITFKPLDI